MVCDTDKITSNDQERSVKPRQGEELFMSSPEGRDNIVHHVILDDISDCTIGEDKIHTGENGQMSMSVNVGSIVDRRTEQLIGSVDVHSISRNDATVLDERTLQIIGTVEVHNYGKTEVPLNNVSKGNICGITSQAIRTMVVASTDSTTREPNTTSDTLNDAESDDQPPILEIIDMTKLDDSDEDTLPDNPPILEPMYVLHL